ncbi:MAG: hypothetical protein JOZ98_03935 [Solirubrobacterales bacterium]|nr:hypothetical protein [Solirubrobacterales bacterium]
MPDSAARPWTLLVRRAASPCADGIDAKLGVPLTRTGTAGICGREGLLIGAAFPVIRVAAAPAEARPAARGAGAAAAGPGSGGTRGDAPLDAPLDPEEVDGAPPRAVRAGTATARSGTTTFGPGALGAGAEAATLAGSGTLTAGAAAGIAARVWAMSLVAAL